MRNQILPTLALAVFLALTLCAKADPAKSSFKLCEEKTKAFLKTDYCMDPKIPKTFFTPEFAALWLKACNPPEGKAIYWGCDPILESQDADPQLLSLGPAETDGENIAVPVVYKHQGAPTYSKVFVFTQHKGRWVIADIITTGLRDGPESEFKKLQADLGR